MLTLLESLRFHAKSIATGKLYINYNGRKLQLASIPESYSTTWCVEAIEASDIFANIEPICMDKTTLQVFIIFLGSMPKDAKFTINNKDDKIIFQSDSGEFELLKDSSNFPIFSDDLEDLDTIDDTTWKSIKKLSNWIHPSSYHKAISGVYIDTNGYLYATDTSNVIISKSNSTFSQPIFIPQSLINQDLSPSKVIVQTGNVVAISMDNIKFVINDQIDGNFVTQNGVFPIKNAKALSDNFAKARKLLWNLTARGIVSLGESLEQYKVSGISDDPTFSVEMSVKENKCIATVIAGKYKATTIIESHSVSDTKKVLSLRKKTRDAIIPMITTIDKKDESASCEIYVGKIGGTDILALSAGDLIVFTNYISIK